MADSDDSASMWDDSGSHLSLRQQVENIFPHGVIDRDRVKGVKECECESVLHVASEENLKRYAQEILADDKTQKTTQVSNRCYTCCFFN